MQVNEDDDEESETYLAQAQEQDATGPIEAVANEVKGNPNAASKNKNAGEKEKMAAQIGKTTATDMGQVSDSTSAFNSNLDHTRMTSFRIDNDAIHLYDLHLHMNSKSKHVLSADDDLISKGNISPRGTRDCTAEDITNLRQKIDHEESEEDIGPNLISDFSSQINSQEVKFSNPKTIKKRAKLEPLKNHKYFVTNYQPYTIMNLLALNIRGLTNKSSLRRLKKIVKTNKVECFAIFEPN